MSESTNVTVILYFFLVFNPLLSNDDFFFGLFVLSRFLLKDGQLWLCAPQAKQIWKCLAENAVFLCDREACFKWYCRFFATFPFCLIYYSKCVNWQTLVLIIFFPFP